MFTKETCKLRRKEWSEVLDIFRHNKMHICRKVVVTNQGTSEVFIVTSRIKQGCVLLLFTTYIDSINKEANPRMEITSTTILCR